ncbi:hypothetical protein [uncultured phage MedDCM-OCT-S05-C767]|nr:hypothetical protein [uncultured phage MedDCM-OCT-S05-C767]
MRAINAMANPTDRKAQEAAKFEFECSEAAQRAYGKTAQGVMLPDEVLRNWNQRDLSAGSDGDLIGQDYRAGDFIDVLRNNSAVMPMATMLNGLSGDVKIPRKLLLQLLHLLVQRVVLLVNQNLLLVQSVCRLRH